MSVQRVVESPRVTKPYSEEQWRAVDAFGRRVEQQLDADDVRVTIGGEPTFVAMDDPDAPEWNTAATGPTKRRFAADLIQRLRARFAPRGLLHYGQGKWYPGEQLPRWAFSLYWRRDGKALWRADKLIAAEANDYGVTADHARRAPGRRGVALGARPRSCHAGVRGSVAFHRPGTEAARESRRGHEPPRRSDGARAARTRLRAGLGQARRLRLARAALERGGLRDAPLEQRTVDDARGQAVSRAGRLAARVPLAAAVADPSTAVAVSARRARRSVRRARASAGPASASGSRSCKARGAGSGARTEGRSGRRRAVRARTAVAVEPRDGHLCVFMPPVAELEDYLDLLAAVEDASAELDLPIHLEGYEPPRDPRLNVIKVTPDPGVIEVNVQPAGELGRDARDHRRALRGRALHAARDREVHARRPAHGHGRRQPRRARRRARGRQPVLAAARSAAQP